MAKLTSWEISEKKMNQVIVIYSVLFILIFLFNWSISELCCDLTIFSLLYIYLALLIVFIIAMVISIIIFVKIRRIYKWKAGFPLFTIILMIILILFFPFRKAKVYTEFILYTPQREKIVDMIAGGQAFGNYSLPLKYRHLSCDGSIYIKRNSENKLVVGFWVFRGLSVNGYSMVYYNSTQDESIFRYLIEDDIRSITKLNSKWYYVVTD